MINIQNDNIILETFRNPENNSFDRLNAKEIIKPILLRTREILLQWWEYNWNIDWISKDILTRACMLDTIFNPLEEKKEWFLKVEWFENEENENENNEDNEENEIYYHTPAIIVLRGWIPIFLNHNYLQALWAKNINELKKDIISWKALEKYYDEDSQEIAKKAVSLLKEWEGYKDLVLKTKAWKIISWNSFWSKKWLEVRIWNDITYWNFQTENKKTDIDKVTLDTKDIVSKYINIVNFKEQDKNTLIVFALLSEIIDKVWNDWQYLMNLTRDDKNHDKFLFNQNYLNTLWLSLAQVKEEIKNWTLYKNRYSPDTLTLIEWLFKILKEDWHYISDFTMIDQNNQRKIYSWFRKEISDEDFKINWTFWIWTSSRSKDNDEILRFLNWI